MTLTQLAIEYQNLELLRAYDKNPRKHSRRSVRKIANSITTNGMYAPIIVDENNEIIAGHGRALGAALAGLSIVPTIRLRGLSKVQKLAVRIADNRFAELSTWDDQLLASELACVIELDPELKIETGFDIIDFDARLTPRSYTANDDEIIPAPPAAPVTRRGDLWTAGGGLLLCGDSLDPQSYEIVLRGRQADTVFQDPPYNCPVPGHVGGKGAVQHVNFAMAAGEMSGDQFEAFLKSTFILIQRHIRNGAIIFACMDWRNIARLVSAGESLGLELKNICAWIKPNAGMGSLYRSQHELVAVFKHGTGPHVNNVQLGRSGRHRSNVWQYEAANSFSSTRTADLADHPTVKPVDMVAEAIRDVTKPGGLVLDPFGGSGTTLIAAELSGRRAVLIELEPKYVDVTLRRFQERTGIEPVLAPDATPLSKVRKTRLETGEI